MARSNAPTSSGNISPRNNGDFASIFANSCEGAVEGSSFDHPETVLTAKSRFASAVHAEEYARARSVVQTLEAREDAKGGKKRMDDGAKDGKSTLAKPIATSGWACRTCGKMTSFKPVSCIHAGHDVRQRRELRGGSSKSLGSRKNRLEMHGKEEEYGGLTLGSGLEWSGWRGELG